MASHRAELGALRAARERIESVLARWGNAAGTVSLATAALDSIAHMEGLVASGRIGPADMATLANVLTVAQSTATALEAASSATAAHAAEQLAAASDEARTTARSVMAGMHDFDGQLCFASSDDRDAYRDREAERRAYIAQQPDTPSGNLNASGAALGQMADAHAHGASGPDFNKRWDGLVATTEKLREVIRQSGGSTQEFDEHLSADLRRIMKAKGLSDAEIDARFAANPEPLEAAKTFVSSSGDLKAVDRSVQWEAKQTTASIDLPAVKAAPFIAVNDLAELRAAGIVVADHPADAPPEHGLAITATGQAAGRIARS